MAEFTCPNRTDCPLNMSLKNVFVFHLNSMKLGEILVQISMKNKKNFNDTGEFGLLPINIIPTQNKKKMNFLFQKTGYTQPRAVRTYAFFKYFNFTEKYAPNLLGL